MYRSSVAIAVIVITTINNWILELLNTSVSAVLVKLSPVIMKPRVLNVRSKATAIPSWVVHVQSKDVSLTAWQQAQLQLQSQQQQQQH